MAKTKRPAILDEFAEADRQLKAAHAKYDPIKARLRPQIEEVLRQSQFPDYRFSERSEIKVDTGKAMKWAHRNLSAEDFESLFVKMFNSEAFLSLMKKKRMRQKRESLRGKGIIRKVPITTITVVQKKPRRVQ